MTAQEQAQKLAELTASRVVGEGFKMATAKILQTLPLAELLECVEYCRKDKDWYENEEKDFQEFPDYINLCALLERVDFKLTPPA